MPSSCPSHTGRSGAGAVSTVHMPRGPNCGMAQLGTGDSKVAKLQVPKSLSLGRFPQPTGAPMPTAPTAPFLALLWRPGWAKLPAPSPWPRVWHSRLHRW